jgi:NhaA family Na+:H+ antiporter
VDDIIAVLVIAVFYTAQIHFFSLAAGLALVALSFGANLLGIRKPAVYALIGICAWFAVLQSGVHATVAGVLLAFTIPARTYLDRDHFPNRCRRLLDRFEAAPPDSSEAHAAIHALEVQCELVESPLHRIEYILQPVSFLIMPLFAFATPACGYRGMSRRRLACRVWVAPGLFGKPLGIWLCPAGGRSSPCNTTRRSVMGQNLWSQLALRDWLHYTLFIANLAFGEGTVLDMSKIGTPPLQ